MASTLTFRMAVFITLTLCTYVWIPTWSSPAPVPDPGDFSEDVNMNVSNLGEALFFLTGVFISAVQPQPKPKVALQLIMPISTRFSLVNFTRVFYTENMTRTPSSVEVRSVMTWTTNEVPGPGDMLKVLCKDTFQHNVVTVLHINNPKVSRNFTDVSSYLIRLLDSVGMPVISWDSDFSNSRKTDRALQLAPTLYHQTEAMLAFMKRFSWPYFSMVTTQVAGHDDFFAALRSQESQSKQHTLPNKFGRVGFEYKILSGIELKSVEDKEAMRLQLYNEMDPDTRVILLHSSPAEAKDILDMAQKMGLTGKEYVWILSATALGDRTAGDSANAYPLGIFAVTYDSSINDMRDVITRGIKVWLQGMVDLDRDGKVEQWHWDTNLSCVQPQLKKWPGGQLLFEYLQNVTLPGDKDQMPTEFTDTGMVKANKLSILNVMRQVDSTPSRPPYSSAYRSRMDRTVDRLYRRRRSRRSLSLSPTSNLPSVHLSFPSGPTMFTGSRGRLFSSESELFSGGSESSQVFSPNKKSDSTESKSKLSDLSSAKFFPSHIKNEDVSLSSSYLTNSRSASETSSVGGLLLSEKNVKTTFHLVTHQKIPSMLTPFISRTPVQDQIDSEDDSSKLLTSGPVDKTETNDIQNEWSPENSQRLYWQDTGKHSPSFRRKRQTRGRVYRQKFQKVATWDGEELQVVQITWPGNSAYPPKGMPETYHLNVVTNLEEPHVTSKPLNEKGECALHATKCMVYERDDKDNRIPNKPKVEHCCSGLSIDILHRISKDLNFNYTLFEVESPGYGTSVENTNNTEWTGVIGSLMKHEADVAMAALSITYEREQVVDFSIPFLETGITIVVAIREGAISPTAFLEPYDYPSWTLILVFSVHATGASIFIFEWLSPYGLDQGHTPLRVHKFSLFRSFWLIWAMLFGAAVSTDTPRGVSSRFLANIWALFAVVFLASYTANLAAFMITKDEYYDLTGIQDWRLKNPHHRQPPFKYATMPNSATETNIRNKHKDLYRYMKKYPQYSVKQAVASLKEQKIQAFIYDATTLEYAVGRDVGCKLKSVGKRYAETGYGVGFPKQSRWTKKFNNILLRMQDEGEIERLQKFWLAGACHKKRQHRGTSSHTLGILNFTSAFILLGGGVILGALLLMMEHVYFRFGRKSLKRWDRCGCCSLVSLSMGKSLTFEQSVMEAIDFQKHHKCRDPLCETQLWKAKHELDIAMLKINQLEKQVAKQAAREGEVSSVASDGATDLSPHTNGTPRKRIVQSSPHLSFRGSKPPAMSSCSENGDSIGGITPSSEQPSTGRSYSSYPAPPHSENKKSPFRTFVRRTRVSDGRIYENVDGGSEIESTI